MPILHVGSIAVIFVIPYKLIASCATGKSAPVEDRCCLLFMPESFKLSDHKVGNLPEVCYIPEYISREEEQSLLSNIEGTRSNWTQVHALPGLCACTRGHLAFTVHYTIPECLTGLWSTSAQPRRASAQRSSFTASPAQVYLSHGCNGIALLASSNKTLQLTVPHAAGCRLWLLASRMTRMRLAQSSCQIMCW